MKESAHAARLCELGFEKKNLPEDTPIRIISLEKELPEIKNEPRHASKINIPGFWIFETTSGELTLAVDELHQIWAAVGSIDLREIGFPLLFETHIIQ